MVHYLKKHKSRIFQTPGGVTRINSPKTEILENFREEVAGLKPLTLASHIHINIPNTRNWLISRVQFLSLYLELRRLVSTGLIFKNDNIHLNNPLYFIQRCVLTEIFKFPFLTFSAPQNVWKLYISSTSWQSTIHILVDTTPIWDVLKYKKIRIPGRYHDRVYSTPLCWFMIYSQ